MRNLFSSPVFLAVSLPFCIDASIYSVPQEVIRTPVSNSSNATAPTHMLFLLGHRLPLLAIPPRLLFLINLIASWGPIKVLEPTVPDQDRLIDNVFEEHLVMGGYDDCPRLCQKVSLEPESCVQVLQPRRVVDSACVQTKHVEIGTTATTTHQKI